MRVLVTGGAGFIGSHVVDRLLDGGHTVDVLDDLSSGKTANLAAAGERHKERLQFHQADVRSSEVGQIVARAQPQVVLHLAAQVDVRRSVADPVHDAEINVLGTVRLLDASRRHGVQKFVLTSSGGTIYGEPPLEALPVDETFDGHPSSPYGASKRAVEEYLYAFAALYGLRWTSLALANVFGPRQDPHGEAGVVSIFGQRMLRDEPLTIFGDGAQTRDFVFVDDVVDAFDRALGAGDGLRCNIGTAQRTSVADLFAQLAELAGYGRQPEHAPGRPGELAHIALDHGRATEVLGWKPTTSLRQGLAATLDWLRN